MRRTEVSPAFVGSLALHLSVLAALLISWHFGRSIKLGTVVPVTIVANAPSTDLRAAEQAPQEQTGQTPEPQPEAPPQTTPPPAPEPKPQPIPKPEPRPTPAPKAEKPAKPEKTLDLDALAASLSKSTHPPKPSSAAKGAARTETALQARPDAGKGLSAAALNGLVADIERRWHPNCEVEGGRDVVIAVSFQLDEGGGVVGQVGTQITRGQGAVAQVAATRAASAVYAAAPFRNLPRDLYGQRIRANFIAQDACS